MQKHITYLKDLINNKPCKHVKHGLINHAPHGNEQKNVELTDQTEFEKEITDISEKKLKIA